MPHGDQHYLAPRYFYDVISYNLSWPHTHWFLYWFLDVPSISCLGVSAFTFLSLEHSSP